MPNNGPEVVCVLCLASSLGSRETEDTVVVSGVLPRQQGNRGHCSSVWRPP